MKKKEGFLIVAGILLLNIAFWTSFLFFPNDESNDEISLFIPDDAQTVVRINNDKFITEITTEILQDNKYEDVLKELFEQQKKESSEGLGIDISKPIYYVGKSKEQSILLHLLDTLAWDKAKQNQLFNKSRFGKIGIIQLSSKVNSIVKKEPKPISLKQSNSLIDFLFEEASGSLTIDKNKLLISGKANFKPSLINALKPKGFHFSTSVIHKAFNDSITNWSKEAIEDIKYLSVNYLGTSVTQNGGFLIEPNCEAIIECGKPIDLSKLVQSNTFFKQFDWKSIDSTTYEASNYRLVLLTPNTLYFDNKLIDCSIVKKSVVLEINGAPKNLTKIMGDRTLSGIISLFPAYSIPNSIFNEIDSLNATIKNGKIDGIIEFKNGQHPLIVIMEKLINQ